MSRSGRTGRQLSALRRRRRASPTGVEIGIGEGAVEFVCIPGAGAAVTISLLLGGDFPGHLEADAVPHLAAMGRGASQHLVTAPPGSAFETKGAPMGSLRRVRHESNPLRENCWVKFTRSAGRRVVAGALGKPARIPPGRRGTASWRL